MGLVFFNPKLEAVFSVQNLPSSVSKKFTAMLDILPTVQAILLYRKPYSFLL
jgi:hypothetical protein